jgi:hypothetical protein
VNLWNISGEVLRCVWIQDVGSGKVKIRTEQFHSILVHMKYISTDKQLLHFMGIHGITLHLLY